MSLFVRLMRTVGVTAAVGATAAATTLAVATPASAAGEEFVALIPFTAKHLDVAHGPGFPTVARNSSGISFAETWRVFRNSDGTLHFQNRLKDAAGRKVSLDTEDFFDTGVGSPGPVGVRPSDNTLSQQWTEKRITANGGVYQYSILTNVWTGRVLTHTPHKESAYQDLSPEALGDEHFIVKQLG